MTMLRLLACLAALIVSGMSAESADRPQDFLVRNWQSEEGLPGNVVRSLGQTPDGLLWVATAEGLARFDGFEFKLISGTTGYRGRRLGFFRLMTPDDGSVWVSTFQGGLLKVQGDRLVRVVEDHGEPNPPLVTHLVLFEETVHYLKGDKLFRIGLDGQELVDPPPDALEQVMLDEIREQAARGRTISPVCSGRLVKRDGGIWEIVGRQLLHRPADNEQPDATVELLDGLVTANDMFEDREGNLWIASPVQGVIRVRPSRVMQLAPGSSLEDQAIRTLIRTRDGSWWLAGRAGGLDRLRGTEIEHLELVAGGYERPVSCLFEDRDGRLWAGSTDGSVFQWDGKSFTRPFAGLDEISKVNSIIQDADGTLWFGGGRGIARWVEGLPQIYKIGTEARPAECSVLTVGSDGTVYSGTTDGRVLALRNGEFVDLGVPAANGGRRVSAIHSQGPDELWVATIGSGLWLWHGGRWHNFDSEAGLPDDRLTGMVATGEGHFWFGSLGGILRASRDSLLRSLTQPGQPTRWLRLDRSDGLSTRECVGGSQPGVWQEPDGSLWFPTTSGPVGVQPSEIDLQNLPPTLLFRPVEINGTPVPLHPDTISAGPGRVRLKFHYTGVCLSAPEKVTYRVRLVGLDDTFQPIGARREMSYESVPPGRYRFEVIATNGDGASAAPASIQLKVRPYFWQLPWFWAASGVAIALFAVAVGMLLTRRRLRRKMEELHLRELLEKERSRISRDLHDDLGASLTELSILSALIAEKPDDDDLPQAVNTLSSKAREVVTTLDEIVWATTPREDSLKSLIEYLAAFAREFLDSARIRLHAEIERQVPDLIIGPRRRHNVFLATREALNNAVKHSKADTISLRIGIEQGELLIRITDNGKGFDSALHSSGHGLLNLKERLKDSGGDCRFHSVPSEGTVVTISLPLPQA